MMRMYFLQYEVEPAARQTRQFGGAIVNCWLKRATKATALRDACTLIEENGWRVTTLIEQLLITHHNQVVEGGKRYYDQALTDNEVLDINTWPAKQRHAPANNSLHRTRPRALAKRSRSAARR